MFSRYYFFACLWFVSVSYSVCCSSSFLLHLLHSATSFVHSFYLPFAAQSVSVLVSSRPSQPNQSHYLTQLHWSRSAALPQSHFHIPMCNDFFHEIFHCVTLSIRILYIPFWFPICNFMIFFTAVQNIAPNKLLSRSIPTTGTVTTFFILFLNWFFTVRSANCVDFDPFVLSRCKYLS